jgi:hypothetical protein
MLRQLDQRICHGLTITLEWEPDTDRLLVSCEDDRSPDEPPLCYLVAPADARRAFIHPFAYAPQRTEVLEKADTPFRRRSPVADASVVRAHETR